MDTHHDVTIKPINEVAEFMKNLIPASITAAREAEQQRDEVVQRHQDRDRYNAERKAKRLENPNANKNEQRL